MISAQVLAASRVPAAQTSRKDVAKSLARALDRLMSATVDAMLADGIGLSIGEAGAREQALEALALWEASNG